MSKVDWITWKTNKNEIIAPDKIYEEVSDKLQESNKIMEVISNSLISEKNNGGLNYNSISIMGQAPAEEKTDNILNRIEYIKQEIEKLRNNIYNSSLEQKKVEKNQLINEINKKIIEEERILDSKINLYEKITPENNNLNKNEIEDIIDISNERIKNLKEKLNQAKEL